MVPSARHIARHALRERDAGTAYRAHGAEHRVDASRVKAMKASAPR